MRLSLLALIPLLCAAHTSPSETHRTPGGNGRSVDGVAFAEGGPTCNGRTVDGIRLPASPNGRDVNPAAVTHALTATNVVAVNGRLLLTR